MPNYATGEHKCHSIMRDSIDGADAARIFISIPSTRKVVLDLAYPDMIDVQFICPPDRVLQVVEEFLSK